MHRLPVPPDLLHSSPATLPPAAAKHLKVIRPRPGEPVELFDGLGSARVYSWNGSALVAAAPRRSAPPPKFRISLFACVTKGSRWDWTVEKAVELGASRIVPILSERCIVRIPPPERPAKLERWRRIAEDAARQSAALWLPEITPALDFPAAMRLLAACRPAFVGALVDPPPQPIAAAASALIPADSADIAVAVGPEGDFSPAEYSALLSIATPVSFGSSILRSETASIYALSVLSAIASARNA